MERYKVTFLSQLHRVMCKVHQFVGEPKSSMGPQHRKRCDVGSQFVGIRFVVHLSKDISTDLSIFLSDVKQFGPGEVVVEVVVEMVVFRKAPEIAVLHLVKICDFSSSDGWHELIINNNKVQKLPSESLQYLSQQIFFKFVY